MEEGEFERMLWQPTDQLKFSSNLWAYMNWLNEKRGLSFESYEELWEWTTENVSEFWHSIWDYFEIKHSGSYSEVLSGHEMPYYQWFTGARLNYAEHVFRQATADQPAIISRSENGVTTEIPWDNLKSSVSSLQQFMSTLGVKSGDRVAAYLPCVPEATVAFLATNSLGAVWSSCSPDFGVNSVLDRFSQIQPKILVAADQYCYNGKLFDKRAVVEQLMNGLPTVEHVLLISNSMNSAGNKSILWSDALRIPPGPIHFERVPFDHPIWILYSSGTTGLPKAITHSNGGILLEQLKYLTFHSDIKKGERCFWYTTTGWMMWNHIQGSLLCGGVLVLYDGSPSYPDLNVLWKYAEEAKINQFGTSAAYIMSCMKAGLTPGKHFNLNALVSIGSTGSTLPEEGFEWVYANVKSDVWLTSVSGGTDVCSAFVGGNPLWPVYAGEIQCRALGCKVEAFNDEGLPLLLEVGEMVITRPMPSMPIYFWNDPDKSHYLESYFETFPGIWRHGDWIKITAHQGIIIYGRSDATLNRGGVRIGTSEVYRAMDQVAEVRDSLIVCIEKPGGEFWMPLFVVTKDGKALTDELKEKINKVLRAACSPRHVPDAIFAVDDVPYTISGKKTEMPVKKILMGKDPDKVINPGSLRNPSSMNIFVDLARQLNT